MAPGDRAEAAEPGAGIGVGVGVGGVGVGGVGVGESHWVRWHAAYEDPASRLSLRLRTVQSMLGAALDEVGEVPAGGLGGVGGAGGVGDPGRPVRIVSLCAGQGRDVIDVVAAHPKGSSVSALLVEQDPDLVRFARDRAAAAGVGDRVRVAEGDASQSRLYAEDVPADIVLVCGVFGNISAGDITHTIRAMRGWCVPRGHVIWTRHRRPPDVTPAVRAEFAEVGFTEVAFVTPEGTIQGIGHHRLDGSTAPFVADEQLFEFVGDGWNPV
ncbi:MAG: methyltransferase domain-containing protein [Acidimicrobiales bacterium]